MNHLILSRFASLRISVSSTAVCEMPLCSAMSGNSRLASREKRWLVDFFSGFKNFSVIALDSVKQLALQYKYATQADHAGRVGITDSNSNRELGVRNAASYRTRSQSSNQNTRFQNTFVGCRNGRAGRKGYYEIRQTHTGANSQNTQEIRPNGGAWNG